MCAFSGFVVLMKEIKCDHDMSSSAFLIVGLGNPGDQYKDTRHNVGFAVVDALCQRWGSSNVVEKWNALTCKVQKDGATVLFIKPKTYMNLSGNAVAGCVSFYKLDVRSVLVVHDDLDMPRGKTKLVLGGGHGGHNGIRSIIQKLGTSDFFRVKYGIGRPGQNDVPAEMPVENFVLGKMTSEEQQYLLQAFDRIESGIEYVLAGNPSKAMNIVNCWSTR